MDPWKHRSTGMQCRTCMWFCPKKANGFVTEIGRCRRHSPTMNGYPVVFVADWCGDHKLNEDCFVSKEGTCGKEEESQCR